MVWTKKILTICFNTWIYNAAPGTGGGAVISANDVGSGLGLSSPRTGVMGTAVFFLMIKQSVVLFILN